MVADLKMAIQLQDLDSRIRDLQHEVASLPRHVAVIEKALESHLRRVEADRAALTANQRERKQLEGDIQVQEQKISKLKDQMLQAKTNEQYAAFKHEIEYCEKEIRKCEDGILDRMAESEPLEQNLKKAETALNQEKQQVEAEKKVARERTAVDKRQLDELKKQRVEAVAAMTPSVYGEYERIRKSRKGIAVTEALDGRCTACNMILRLQFFQDLLRCDQVMYCESCSRILYYTPPPVEVDELGGGEQAPQAVESSESHPVETGR
jgi:predicted  nucleic acid-binding Zn-ribbon protein